MPGKPRLPRLASTLALLLLLATSLSYAQAESYTMPVTLLAVTESGKGVLVNATAGIKWPGEGLLAITPRELVDKSTITSTMVAYIYAAIIAQRNPLEYNAILEIQGIKERVSGPSASLPLAVAYTLLLTGHQGTLDSIAMTGMATPIGLVLPVRGVEAKAEAAREAGYRVVVIPYTEPSTPKLEGVNLVQVCTVDDAIEVVIGYRASNQTITRTQGLISEATAKFREEARKLIDYARKLLDTLPSKPPKTVEALQEAEKAYRRGDWYAAASLAYYALARMVEDASRRGLNPLILLEDTLGVRLENLLSKAAQTLEQASSTSAPSLWRLEALANAALRLYIAEHLALTKSPKLKAYALLRALTTLAWAKVAVDVGPRIPLDQLRRTVQVAVKLASESLAYVKSLGVKKVVMQDNRPASQWLEDARSYYLTGTMYGLVRALALSLNIIATCSYVLEVSAETSMGKIMKCLWEKLNEAITRSTQVYGYPSMTSLLLGDYVEKAGILEERAKLVLLTTAATWAMLPQILAAVKQPAQEQHYTTKPATLAALLTLPALAAALGVYAYSRLLRKEVEEANLLT